LWKLLAKLATGEFGQDLLNTRSPSPKPKKPINLKSLTAPDLEGSLGGSMSWAY